MILAVWLGIFPDRSFMYFNWYEVP